MGTQAHAVRDEKPIPWIARQPILTDDETVIGYELLFCRSPEEHRFTSDADSGTSATIDTLSVMGFDVLCDGHLAFIDCTRQMLLKEWFALLPSSQVVVEIQETVAPDESVVAAYDGLKQAGYTIALDNFVPGDEREPLVPYAGFIKVDTKEVASDKVADLVARYAGKHCHMLAQKVETRLEYIVAMKNRFTHFRAISSANPNGCGHDKSPPTKPPTCVFCRRSQNRRWILPKLKI